MLRHLGLLHPLRRHRGRADAHAARDERRPRVVGDRVLVERDAGPVEHLLRDLAGELGVERAQVDEQQVVVGAARHEPEALGGERRGERLRVAHDLLRRSRGSSGRRPRGTRPPWPRSRARADRPADRGTPPCRSRCRSSAVDTMQPPRGPRSVLCVVKVTTSACGTGFGMHAAGDEAGDVRGVEEEQRADLVGDLAERHRIDDARVRGRAGDDQLRALGRARGRGPGRGRCARRTA